MSKAFKIYIAFASAGIFLAGLAYLFIVPRYDRSEEYVAKKEGFRSVDERKQYKEIISSLVKKGVKDVSTRNEVSKGLREFSPKKKIELITMLSFLPYDAPKPNSAATNSYILNQIGIARRDANPNVRDMAALLLTNFKGEEADSMLSALADNDPSDFVRSRAKSIIADRNKK